MAEAKQQGIRCALMRGGTSRGVLLLRSDLPRRQTSRDEVILGLFGNPDPFQADGIGGAAPWASLVALLDRSRRPGVDLEVVFGRVIVGASFVDYSTTSGDLLAAVAQFAIDEGLVEAAEPVTTVRVLDAATENVVVAEVPVINGEAQVEGPCVVGSVPGSGACIRIVFSDLPESRHPLLPTGSLQEELAVPFGEYVVSIVNAATPVVFVNAETLGLVGTELPAQLRCDAGFLERVEAIRGAAAETMGLVPSRLEAATRSPMRPRLVTVFESTEYIDALGREVSVMDTDLTCREISMGTVHYAFDVEVAVCTAVAAHMRGTVVWDALLREEAPSTVRIGHPTGVIAVDVDVQRENGAYDVRGARLETTARRIMDGVVYRRPGM